MGKMMFEDLKNKYSEEHKKEIETIRERNIKLKLSDADCDKISRLCGEHGIAVGYLLESFISDLIGGTHTNGSDERDLADSYFYRCSFGMFPEKTLLNMLLSSLYDGVDVRIFLRLLEEIENAKKDLADYKEDPDAWTEEEINFVKEDLESLYQRFEKIKSDFFKENPTANWDEELKKVNEWWAAREELING